MKGAAPGGFPAAQALDREQPAPSVSWIRDAPARPICDVPWLGGSLVLSGGDVSFCCFSSAVVGNVNETPFRDIWNGATMQRIRQSLIAGVLPPECAAPRCPIYRRDDRHYLVERMNSPHVQTLPDGELKVDQAILATRASMKDTRLQLHKSGGAYDLSLSLQLDFAAADQPVSADLFIAIDSPAGGRRFLPNHDFAVPHSEAITCDGSQRVAVDSAALDEFLAAPGLYRLCAALFECGANPNILANCYWAATESFRIA
jgi:hypothetical protein